MGHFTKNIFNNLQLRHEDGLFECVDGWSFDKHSEQEQRWKLGDKQDKTILQIAIQECKYRRSQDIKWGN